MRDHWEIRFGGTGGQGLITAGVILAEAAIIDGKNAVQSQSYGPESRGGSSKAEVMIANDSIDYMKVLAADVLLVMSPEAAKKYCPEVKDDAVVIIDSTYVKDEQPVKGNVYRVNISLLAKQEVGREVVANIVALGVLVGLTKVVSWDALVQAVLARVPKGTEEMNKKALQVGLDAVKGLIDAA
ncbi:2-oxoacid:acceptor oxidoreductase family protein [Heliophilum fasciatum]|uniref:2-oxoglutarate ferredoxin oxidoreductase subunit gamma n=1 Tax=Heliophilum fasciatum TaxID=35700 RepID=A0A4R2RXI9_9FIRM|nr:2-oxoacid:acceptor oxidoreductase family protein [Heliophilum fasciatum]MCW2277167.1 2-oxoglutarate ferredoxin oxidoreductase subunit gamma [Heliophilum fasciatum]TCP68198.1 2-oxoglutarate ferredoxin oxidoreductase subunit gamma [Heliophilum fasciatum]